MEPGHGVQERLQIPVLRLAEDVFQGAGLHHLAAVQDDDFVGHVGDDAQVVGDDQDRHAQFGLQV